MAVCGKCGAELRDGAKFCTKCGSAVKNYCPECGAEVMAGDLFCAECGKALNDVASGKMTQAPRERDTSSGSTTSTRFDGEKYGARHIRTIAKYGDLYYFVYQDKIITSAGNNESRVLAEDTSEPGQGEQKEIFVNSYGIFVYDKKGSTACKVYNINGEKVASFVKRKAGVNGDIEGVAIEDSRFICVTENAYIVHDFRTGLTDVSELRIHQGYEIRGLVREDSKSYVRLVNSREEHQEWHLLKEIPGTNRVEPETMFESAADTKYALWYLSGHSILPDAHDRDCVYYDGEVLLALDGNKTLWRWDNNASEYKRISKAFEADKFLVVDGEIIAACDFGFFDHHISAISLGSGEARNICPRLW